MEYLFLFVSLYLLIFFFPWYITFYTEKELKCHLIMFGFIRLPINLKRIARSFVTRQSLENRDFNIMEVVENFKKMLSTRPIYHDLFKKAKINHLYWYSAIPMENPLLGLSLLPIYSIAQAYLVDSVHDHFKEVHDVDVDTKYNYINNDVFIYFDCIIKINLAKIISVSVKYINKIPLLFKRIS